MGDLDAIVEMDRKVLGKGKSDYWKNKVELPDTRYPLSCFVAEIDGKVSRVILGEVSRWEFGISDTIGWISIIGVDPAYHHQSIAE